MLRSIYSGVSGLTAHQTKLDVIGDNIANVNTIGFKKSTVNFEEALSSTIESAQAPQGGYGGQNAVQIGSGTQISSINTDFEKGNMQYTGLTTDLRIDGDGFFTLSDGFSTFYTRAGDFQLDGEGNLVTSDGLKVQGWQASKRSDGTTEISAGTPLGDLNVKLGEILPAKATSVVSYAGNLNQSAGLESITISVDADGSGPEDDKIDITIDFKYDPDLDRWNWEATGPDGYGITGNGGFDLEGGSISEVYKGTEIRNADGIVLVRDPIPGDITFYEVKQSSNAVTAPYVSNKEITSNEVYDSLGNNYTLSMTYTKIDQNMWTWEANEASGLPVQNGKGVLVFDGYGQQAGNYRLANIILDDTTPEDLTLATIGTELDEDNNPITTVPTGAELGVAWDTTVMSNYYIKNQDGTYSGNPTSPYEINNVGVIIYRGAIDSNGDGRFDQDENGNPIDVLTLTSDFETGQVVNKSYSGNLMFDPAGEGGALPPSAGAQPVKILADFGNISQFANDTSVVYQSQNGYKMGQLETFRIQDNGDIIGFYSNNYKQVVGRVALTNFYNSSGLEKVGGSNFIATANSGDPILLEAGEGGGGTLQAGYLEMSNVDLSAEFTDMIIAQRGFQANSKTITTADEILQELIGLKR